MSDSEIQELKSALKEDKCKESLHRKSDIYNLSVILCNVTCVRIRIEMAYENKKTFWIRIESDLSVSDRIGSGFQKRRIRTSLLDAKLAAVRIETLSGIQNSMPLF